MDDIAGIRNLSRLSYLGLSRRSAVHVTPVPHMYNGDNLPPVIDFVDDAVVAHANPPTFTASQLAAVMWPGIVAQATNCVTGLLVSVRGELRQFFLSTA